MFLVVVLLVNQLHLYVVKLFYIRSTINILILFYIFYFKAVLKACEILNDRLKPIKEEQKDASFKDLARAAFLKSVDLSATYMYKASDLKNYNVFALSSTEVEVDLLTGNILINRADIMEDTGESISPFMDIGQIEGAFMMGLGYWLTENIVYGADGELLTNRTWNYKPPGAKDIPVDFRIHFFENTQNDHFVLRSKGILMLEIVIK